MKEYKYILVLSNSGGAEDLVKLFKEGWEIVDKLPYSSEGSLSNIRQYYIMSRTKAAKELYEGSL